MLLLLLLLLASVHAVVVVVRVGFGDSDVAFSPAEVTVQPDDTLQILVSVGHNAVQVEASGSLTPKAGGLTTGPEASSSDVKDFFIDSAVFNVGDKLYFIDEMTDSELVVSVEAKAATPSSAPEEGTLKPPQEHLVDAGLGGFHQFHPQVLDEVFVSDTVEFRFHGGMAFNVAQVSDKDSTAYMDGGFRSGPPATGEADREFALVITEEHRGKTLYYIAEDFITDPEDMRGEIHVSATGKRAATIIAPNNPSSGNGPSAVNGPNSSPGPAGPGSEGDDGPSPSGNSSQTPSGTDRCLVVSATLWALLAVAVL